MSEIDEVLSLSRSFRAAETAIEAAACDFVDSSGGSGFHLIPEWLVPGCPGYLMGHLGSVWRVWQWNAKGVVELLDKPASVPVRQTKRRGPLVSLHMPVRHRRIDRPVVTLARESQHPNWEQIAAQYRKPRPPKKQPKWDMPTARGVEVPFEPDRCVRMIRSAMRWKPDVGTEGRRAWDYVLPNHAVHPDGWVYRVTAGHPGAGMPLDEDAVVLAPQDWLRIPVRAGSHPGKTRQSGSPPRFTVRVPRRSGESPRSYSVIDLIAAYHGVEAASAAYEKLCAMDDPDGYSGHSVWDGVMVDERLWERMMCREFSTEIQEAE